MHGFGIIELCQNTQHYVKVYIILQIALKAGIWGLISSKMTSPELFEDVELQAASLEDTWLSRRQGGPSSSTLWAETSRAGLGATWEHNSQPFWGWQWTSSLNLVHWKRREKEHTNTHINTHAHTNAYGHAHSHTHAQTHTFMHTYIHTYPYNGIRNMKTTLTTYVLSWNLKRSKYYL